jgi:hypothetical protein
MAQVDHVIDARTEEIIGGGTGKQHGRTPRNLPLVEFKLRVPAIRDHHTVQCLRGLRGFFRDDEVVALQEIGHVQYVVECCESSHRPDWRIPQERETQSVSSLTHANYKAR